MNQRKNNLIFSTILHMLVDLVCIMTLWSIENNNRLKYTLIYIILAFGLQFIVGYYLDITKNKWVGSVGVILVFLGSLFRFNKILSVILIGFGNAMFHSGSALLVIHESKGKVRDLGIFVSSGAIGVSLGYILDNLIVSVMLLIINLFWMIDLHRQEKIKYSNYNFELAIKNKGISYIIIIVTIGIIIRSMGGGSNNIYTLTGFTGIMLLGICACIGKFCGGILCDKFSAINVSIVSLGIGIILFSLSNINSIKNLCFLLGILCFNMIMPTTLGIIIDKLRGFECFGFGLTTLGLLVGSIIQTLFIRINTRIYLITYSLIAIIIVVLTTERKVNK